VNFEQAFRCELYRTVFDYFFRKKRRRVAS
jgi:hypothetical protein